MLDGLNSKICRLSLLSNLYHFEFGWWLLIEIEIKKEDLMVEKQYNLAFLKDYFNDDLEYILPILRLYVVETPKDLNEIERALSENNVAKAKAITHKIKTNVAMLGFVNTGTFVNDMHNHPSDNDVSESLIKSFNQFKEGVSAGLQQIQEDFLKEEN